MTILDTRLSHAERTIFFHLCLCHFRFAGSRPGEEFFLTDRDLSKNAGVCLWSVVHGKKKLKKLGLIKYYTGEKNKTYYSILY